MSKIGGAVCILFLFLGRAGGAHGAPVFVMPEQGTENGPGVFQGGSSKAQAVWKSAWFPLEPGADGYFGDGWIKPETGAAWLELQYAGKDGRALGHYQSPRVKAGADWTYVAVDVPPVTSAGITAQVVFWVKGKAGLEKVSLRPVPRLGVMNGDFETPLDRRGRISYWNEEPDTALLPGKREGRFTLSEDEPGQGGSSARFTATGAWFAMTSIHYPVWEWTRDAAVEALIRTQTGAAARVGLVWTDPAEKVLRVDLGDEITAPGWREVRVGPFEPPTGAHLARPLLVTVNKTADAEEATALFDAVSLRMRDRPYARLLVNQVGYASDGPKTVIAMTNTFPSKNAAATFHVMKNSRPVYEGALTCAGRMYGAQDADWGWYFWRGDFTGLNAEGEYRIEAKLGKNKAESYPVRIGRDILFQHTASLNVDFFFVQRCGVEVPGWHAACHMDCAKLPDGAHRDLTGGWHSAGDYNKLNWEYGDGGVAYALIRAYETAPEFFQRLDRNQDGLCDILDEAWWGAQFLAKVQIPETGGILNHIEQGPDRSTWMRWCPPEQTTDNVVGTPDDPIVLAGEGNSPLAIGAWARLARLLEARGVKTDYLERAKRLWEHAAEGGAGGPSPLLLISAVDLYFETQDARYLDYARRGAGGLMAQRKPDGQLRGGYGDTGDIPAAALAYFALRFPDDALAPAIRECLLAHTPGFVAEAANPLGLMMQQPGAEGYYFDPSSSLGCNYQIGSRAWSALMAYRVTGDERLMRYAVDQLDFLFGRNPYELCMFEGAGAYNLPRYHHRYITIPGHERGAVPGAIPNGFVRDIAGNDRPGVDLSTGGRPYPSYRTNEPWLVHNVFFTLAITALHEIETAEKPAATSN